MSPAKITKEDFEDIQIPNLQEVEEPEAFVPQFNVAPDAIPQEQQIHIPTEEEKKATIEGMYKKLGVKAKEFIQSPVQEITPEKEQAIGKNSMLAGRIISTGMTWGYSIFGAEYGILAPTPEQSDKIIRPLLRIEARHTDILGKISPDAEDAIECLTAVSEYAVVCMQNMQMIREEKLYGRPANERQARTGNRDIRSGNIWGSPVSSPDGERNENAGSGNGQFAQPHGNLTPDEQRNFEQLSQLARRDFEARARKSGRV